MPGWRLRLLILEGVLAHYDWGVQGCALGSWSSSSLLLGSCAEKSGMDQSCMGTKKEVTLVSKWAVSQNKNKSKGNHSGVSWGFSPFVWKSTLPLGLNYSAWHTCVIKGCRKSDFTKRGLILYCRLYLCEWGQRKLVWGDLDQDEVLPTEIVFVSGPYFLTAHLRKKFKTLFLTRIFCVLSSRYLPVTAPITNAFFQLSPPFLSPTPLNSACLDSQLLRFSLLA